MGEIKKITIRLNLEDSIDSRIWKHLEDVQPKKRTNCLKDLVLSGLKQEQQEIVLKEIRELRQMLMGGSPERPLHENREVTVRAEPQRIVAKETQESFPVSPEKEPDREKPVVQEAIAETAEIDPTVMNFLDNL